MRRLTWGEWAGVAVLTVATLASCSREMRQGAGAATGERRAVAPPAAPAPTPAPVWQEHRELWNLVRQWARLHGPERGDELRELYAQSFRGLDLRPRGVTGLFDLAHWHSTFLIEGDPLWVSSIEIQTWQDPGSTLPRDHARVRLWAGIDSDGWESSRSEGLHRLALHKQAGVWRITSEQLEQPTAHREPLAPVTARELSVGLLRGRDDRDDDRLTQLTLGSSEGTQVIDLELDVGHCKPGPTSSADELFVLVCGDEPLHRVWLRRDAEGLVLERGGTFCDKCNPRRKNVSLWSRRRELIVALPPTTRVNPGMLQ